MSKRGTDCALVLIRRGAHEAHRGTDRDGDGTSALFWRHISLCNCFGVLIAIQLRSTVSPALPTLSKTQDKSLQGCFEFVLFLIFKCAAAHMSARALPSMWTPEMIQAMLQPQPLVNDDIEKHPCMHAGSSFDIFT